MKKQYLFFALFLFIASGVNAQWVRTHVNPTEAGQIEAFCEHNGDLYVADFSQGLMKMNPIDQKWEKVNSNLPPSTNSAHIINLQSSNNYLYAYVKDQYCAGMTIYRSADNGIKFETDTLGLPVFTTHPYKDCLGRPKNASSVYVLDGKIINITTPCFSKYPKDEKWEAETHDKVKFSDVFGSFNGNWYTWTSGVFYISKDKGKTWTIPDNVGMVNSVQVKILDVNLTTGRIYLAGGLPSRMESKLMYSDNEGATWDTLPINQYLKINWIGLQQNITDMISKGDEITAVLVNDKPKTNPDVIKSIDGGLTFTADTVGLYADPNGASNSIKMLYHKDALYMAINVLDVYKQDKPTGIGSLNKTSFKVYPNPVANNLRIENTISITSLELTNILGKVILNEFPMQNNYVLDLSNLTKGVYFLKINSANQSEVVKLLKN